MLIKAYWVDEGGVNWENYEMKVIGKDDKRSLNELYIFTLIAKSRDFFNLTFKYKSPKLLKV